MTVQDFLDTYKNSMLLKKPINPLSSRNNSEVKPSNLGVSTPAVKSSPQSTFGQQIPDWLQGRTSGAIQRYMQNKSERTTDLASKYTDMAAGQIPVDSYGVPTDKTTDFADYFNKSLSTIGDTGKNALATEESKARWQTLQSQAELNAGYAVNWTPGASSGNKGAQAVSIAMEAVKNNTPYAWGGNSLVNGVDCSGLVQQVYGRMGIKVPRTTYEQAKNGKVISIGSLLPGDLVFYNTGSRDPNGIGSLSHVAIYIGNGQVIDAPGRGKTVRVTSLNNNGSPARAVRPW